MQPKIHFVTLATSDLAAAKNFYQHAFGFPLMEETDTLILFELEDRFSLALQSLLSFQEQAGAGSGVTGAVNVILSHQVSSSKAVDEIVEKALQFGATRVGETKEEWGYSVIIAGPDGHRWEIVHFLKQ